MRVRASCHRVERSKTLELHRSGFKFHLLVLPDENYLMFLNITILPCKIINIVSPSEIWELVLSLSQLSTLQYI